MEYYWRYCGLFSFSPLDVLKRSYPNSHFVYLLMSINHCMTSYLNKFTIEKVLVTPSNIKYISKGYFIIYVGIDKTKKLNYARIYIPAY